ncbi:MAG: hypothetical protein HY700_06610 [Gemmatimonadetes bacterium]|nr:hypothetical protein [Gemmatimonadota bacterium]
MRIWRAAVCACRARWGFASPPPWRWRAPGWSVRHAADWTKPSGSPECGPAARGTRRCGRHAVSSGRPKAIAGRPPRCSKKLPSGSRAPAGHGTKRAAARKPATDAIAKLRLSARAYHRILKIPRTITDLAGAADIEPAHVSEAVQYRSLDRGVG